MYKTEIFGDYKVYLGENAKGNWEMFDDADLEDMWFHDNDFPSRHVILSSDRGDSPDKEVIKHCAALSKSTKAAYPKKSRIIYTQCRNLRKGRHLGEMVILDPKKCHFVTVS